MTYYVYNNILRSNNTLPSDLFFGTRVPRYTLQNMHVWDCPVYVLNPSLQADKKIPRWEPRYKRRVFCGLSMVHSSEVPQVLNLTTGSIITQFHVVFDDLFTTISLIEKEEQPPSHWSDLCLDNTELIPMDNPPPLSSEWLNEMNGTQDIQATVRTNQVQQDLHTSNTRSQQEPLFLPND